MFTVITIREPREGNDRLYPLVNASSTEAMLDRETDGLVDRLVAKSLEINHFGKQKAHSQAKLEETAIDVAITDSRVVVWCERYDTGGGWRGSGIFGVLFMAVANVVSKVRAANRRRGNCLVGHVRYTWIHQVGYRSRKTTFGRTEELRLVVIDGTQKGSQVTVGLDLRFGADMSARKIASEIAQRAARFRLAHKPDLDDGKREKLEQLAASGLTQGSDGRSFTLVSIPGALVVKADTAVYAATTGDGE